MYCEACGYELHIGETVCPICGTPVPGTDQSLLPTSEMKTTPIDNAPVFSGQVSSQIPASEMQTTRVTITGETGGLYNGDNQELMRDHNMSKRNENVHRVKARPKHLALKIAVLFFVLVGAGIGVWLGIRYLKNKTVQAYYKKPTVADIEIEPDGTAYVKHQLLIRGQKDVTKSQISELVEEKKGSIVGEIPYCNDYQVEFEPTTTKEMLEKILTEWRGKTELIAKADYHKAFAAQGGFHDYTKDDWWDDNEGAEPSGFSEEWDVYNPEGNNWGAESVWAPKVWESDTSYREVNTGILDTAFDTTHPDLKDRFQSVTGARKDENGKPIDMVGSAAVADAYKAYAGRYGNGSLTAEEAAEEKRLAHGTHISGVIGATIENDHGIAGVAQNSKLHGYSISETADYQYTTTFEWEYALSRMFEQEVYLVNVSMQIRATNAEIEMINDDLSGFLTAYLETGKDFLLVKSAGDEKKADLSKDFLCGIKDQKIRDHMIIVGGAEPEKDIYGMLSGYKRTTTTNYGKEIDIYAPGVNVLSDIPTDRTEKRDGTSDAAAFVTGGCALVMGILPDASLTDVKKIILENFIYTVKDTDKGYLNLYLATEVAVRMAKEGGSTSGKTVLKTLLAEIEKNKPAPTIGVLRLTISADTLGAVSGNQITGEAKNGSQVEQFSFDVDGGVQVPLSQGEWNITIHCEGFHDLNFSKTVNPGTMSSEDGISLQMIYDWRQAYIDYISANNRFAEGKIYSFIKTMDDYNWDGIPELMIFFTQEASNGTLDLLYQNVLYYIEDQTVKSKVISFKSLQEMSLLQLEAPDECSIRISDAEYQQAVANGSKNPYLDELSFYIRTADYARSEKNQEQCILLFGDHLAQKNSANVFRVMIECFNGKLRLCIAMKGKQQREVYYYGYCEWSENGTISVKQWNPHTMSSHYTFSAELTLGNDDFWLRNIVLDTSSGGIIGEKISIEDICFSMEERSSMTKEVSISEIENNTGLLEMIDALGAMEYEAGTEPGRMFRNYTPDTRLDMDDTEVYLIEHILRSPKMLIQNRQTISGPYPHINYSETKEVSFEEDPKGLLKDFSIFSQNYEVWSKSKVDVVAKNIYQMTNEQIEAEILGLEQKISSNSGKYIGAVYAWGDSYYRIGKVYEELYYHYDIDKILCVDNEYQLTISWYSTNVFDAENSREFLVTMEVRLGYEEIDGEYYWVLYESRKV